MDYGFRQESGRPAALDQQRALDRRLAALNDALGSGRAPDPVALAQGRTARLTETTAREGLDTALLSQHDAAQRIAEGAQQALGAVSAALDDLAATLGVATTGAQPGAAFVREHSAATLQDLAGLLNTAVGRDYVFAGQNAATPPLDITALDALGDALSAYAPSAASGIDAQFDDFITTNAALVDAVFAASPVPRPAVTGPAGDITAEALTTQAIGARQSLLAVLEPLFIATHATDMGSDETTRAMHDAVAALKAATTATIDGQARLGAYEARLESSAAFLQTRRDLLQATAREALAADPVETSVELFQAQAQLEASIDALARILSLDIGARLR